MGCYPGDTLERGGGVGIYFGTFLKECIHYNFLLLYFICKLLCVCCLIKNNCKSTFLSLLPSSANVPDFFLQTNDGTTDVQVESIIKVQCETQLDKMTPTMTTDPNFQTLSSEILTLVCPNDCSNNGQCEGGKNNSQRMGFRCKVDL